MIAGTIMVSQSGLGVAGIPRAVGLDGRRRQQLLEQRCVSLGTGAQLAGSVRSWVGAGVAGAAATVGVVGAAGCLPMSNKSP
jgi:hypothetical protein